MKIPSDNALCEMMNRASATYKENLTKISNASLGMHKRNRESAGSIKKSPPILSPICKKNGLSTLTVVNSACMFVIEFGGEMSSSVATLLPFIPAICILHRHFANAVLRADGQTMCIFCKKDSPNVIKVNVAGPGILEWSFKACFLFIWLINSEIHKLSVRRGAYPKLSEDKLIYVKNITHQIINPVVYMHQACSSRVAIERIREDLDDNAIFFYDPDKFPGGSIKFTDPDKSPLFCGSAVMFDMGNTILQNVKMKKLGANIPKIAGFARKYYVEDLMPDSRERTNHRKVSFRLQMALKGLEN